MPYLATTLLLIAFCGLSLPYPPSLPAAVPLSRVTVSRAAEADRLGQEIEITGANWLHNPKIKAVRAIVNSVNTGMRKGTFKTSERKFESCGDQYFTLRRIARNSKGVIVWYEEYSEGEDASRDFHHYYDRAGRLRFVIAFARAANGMREQHRIYFDETGKRIWEANKRVKGLGCPGCFLDPYPDEGLAFDPTKAFAKDDGCKEIKPRLRRRAE